MHFRIIYHLGLAGLALIVCCMNRIVSTHLMFKDGGPENLLNEKTRTLFVNKGETARLTWVFKTNKNVVFHGIVWTIFDNSYQKYSKLLWMDRFEGLFRYYHTKDRTEYDVKLFPTKINETGDVELTIRIPNVQYVHQTTYICHVIRSNVRSSLIELKIIEPPNNVTITSSNGTTILENTQATFTCFVKGTPDPRVSWCKDNVTLSPYQESNASFTKIFSKQDEGTYECVVNNTFGMVFTKDVHIYVRRQNRSEMSAHVPDIVWNEYLGELVTTGTVAARGTKSGKPVEFFKRNANGTSGFKIKPLPVILITCSVAVVIFTILAIILFRQRIRRAELKRKARSLYSIGNADTELRTMSHASSHVNKRISDDSGAGINCGNDNSESMRTGFSYQDSSDEYEQSDCPTTFTFGGILAKPVKFSRIRQHSDVSMENTPSNFVLLSESEEYEIDRYLLQDLQPIGEGAFGVVAKAKLLKQRNGKEKQTVAVKMLKGFASPEDRQDLISELNIMSRIEPHNNVVRLIGCVTTSAPLYVITEFVCHGDLLGFLRKNRGLVDTIYFVKENIPRSTLSQDQLLRMARDVAMGMDHLSRYRVIHRDLAARNVLVGKHLQCKITDFGMARDVKSTNYYRKRSRGRIPLKWTAIEALTYDKYTIESDVWSFGILLYEIVTIGGSPYPGLGARELLRKLKRGWRMPKPAHVNITLYQIMKKCWSSNPEERPTFSELARTFTNLKSCDSEYINVTEYDGDQYLHMDENISADSADLKLTV